MTRMYNRDREGDQVTAGRGAMSANPHGAPTLYAGVVTGACANQEEVFSNAFAVWRMRSRRKHSLVRRLQSPSPES